jgi:SlyX protein
MESRLTDLEIRLTHQEAALDAINDTLLKQARVIDALRGELERVQRQLRDITASNIASASEETPPPHY